MKAALDQKVEDVRSSRRLTTSPACLVAAQGQMSTNMERLLRAAGQEVSDVKRTLELNMAHPIVQHMQGLESEQFDVWCDLLYDQSVLAEGGRPDDPAEFVKRMNQVVLDLAAARD